MNIHTITYILYLNIFMATHHVLSMHNLSQPGQKEANLTSLGLLYLPETDQERFFEFLNREDIKNPAFRRLLKSATSNKFGQRLQPIKKKQRSSSI